VPKWHHSTINRRGNSVFSLMRGHLVSHTPSVWHIAEIWISLRVIQVFSVLDLNSNHAEGELI
jgi:hypothetical protein